MSAMERLAAGGSLAGGMVAAPAPAGQGLPGPPPLTGLGSLQAPPPVRIQERIGHGPRPPGAARSWLPKDGAARGASARLAAGMAAAL